MNSFEHRIAGMPCIIEVDYVFVQEPMGPRADSDQDCYGYAEVDFTVCDRKGYVAPWLRRKMTVEEGEEIENKILELAGESA